VCERRVLRKIFGPKKEEVIGGWRKLHYEALRKLYSSPNVIRIIRSRRLKWTGHVAHNREEKCIQNFVRNPEGRDYLGDLGILVDRKIILNWILKKEDMRM
jgi:hypothetical protein